MDAKVVTIIVLSILLVFSLLLNIPLFRSIFVNHLVSRWKQKKAFKELCDFKADPNKVNPYAPQHGGNINVNTQSQAVQLPQGFVIGENPMAISDSLFKDIKEVGNEKQ